MKFCHTKILLFIYIPKGYVNLIEIKRPHCYNQNCNNTSNETFYDRSNHFKTNTGLFYRIDSMFVCVNFNQCEDTKCNRIQCIVDDLQKNR